MGVLILGAGLLVLGSVESANFNGLDVLGWAVLAAGVASVWTKWARS